MTLGRTRLDTSGIEPRTQKHMSNNEVAPISYGVADAAKAIGVSRAYMYRLLGEGKIAAKKIGARTIITTAELTRFVSVQPAFVPGEPVAG